MNSTLLEVLIALVLGAYGWAWLLYTRASKGLKEVWEYLRNEQTHELQALRDRVKELEDHRTPQG